MIDDLLTALEHALEAKHALQACLEAGAYDSDYFCGDRHIAYDLARVDLAVALDRIIEDRVADALGTAAPAPDPWNE